MLQYVSKKMFDGHFMKMMDVVDGMIVDLDSGVAGGFLYADTLSYVGEGNGSYVYRVKCGITGFPPLVNFSMVQVSLIKLDDRYVVDEETKLNDTVEGPKKGLCNPVYTFNDNIVSGIKENTTLEEFEKQFFIYFSANSEYWKIVWEKDEIEVNEGVIQEGMTVKTKSSLSEITKDTEDDFYGEYVVKELVLDN